MAAGKRKARRGGPGLWVAARGAAVGGSRDDYSPLAAIDKAALLSSLRAQWRTKVYAPIRSLPIVLAVAISRWICEIQ